MTRSLRSGLVALALILAAFGALKATAAADDPATIVKGAIDYWRDVTSYTVVEMTVHRPDWERASLMRAWTRGEKDSLVRFVKPARDAGSATLKVGDDMWIFSPKLNRVIKLPFSMMAQSWMGSDFSYNDLAKSDQIIHNFTHRLVKTDKQDGHAVYVIESTPLPNAPVIWGKERLRIRDDHLLLEETFFDQDGKPVKRLSAVKIGRLGGKVYVTSMRMEKLDEADHWTEITYRKASFGLSLPDAVFTLSNLRNPRPGWERP
ncbi:MAG: outer membrane lipoprotein-sorting protein [Acidobacteria bacterium]|nr:outer membrane lipoprotein-sorting protein [Acidobacteriota bacterium]